MRILMAFALAAAFCGSANATTSVTSVSADFSNPVGGGGTVRYTDTNGLPGNEEIRWGRGDTPSSKSGLRFDGGPAQAITQGITFTLGSLTYYNFPIDAGTEVSSVDLGITATLDVDGTPLAAGPFTFSITVDETPNEGRASQCPYVSQIPCSDKISITTGAASQTFEIGSQTLTLYIDGFLDKDLVPQSSFIAQERETSIATLIGHFDLASPVPEPASWALFLGGFGLLGGALRRDRIKLSPAVS